MVEVDLRAAFVPANQKVWRMFPGHGYQFLNDFVDRGAIFLDLPNLVLPEGRISEATDMVSRIAMSQASADFLKEHGPDAELQFRLEQFNRQRKSQSIGRARQALINLSEELIENDIVIIPEPMYLSYVRVGRVTGRRLIRAVSEENYGRVSLPGRSVEWVARVRENQISTALSNSLRSQHAFTLLERSLFVEVFSLAYSSFVYGDRHVSTIFNEDEFLDTDSAFLGIISRLAAAALRSIDEGREGIDRGELLDILINSPPIEYTCNQESDIHSKGFTRFISGSLVALVISSLTATYMGLAEGEHADQVRTEIDELTIINTGTNADPACTAWVSEATRRVVNSFDTEQTMIMCQNIRRANARGALRPSARPRPTR